MSTPNQELMEIVCGALIEAGIANEKEVTSLKSRALAGKVKPEDWYFAIENSLKQPADVKKNGN